MKNNNLSIIDEYNKLFKRIEKSVTVEDMRQLFVDVKEFVGMYENVDSNSTKLIFQKYADKLHNMLSENDVVFARLSENAEEIRIREYDFSNETDDVSSVQMKVLQLIGELPKAKTTANATTISNVIEKAIKSGVIGCKAICELLKYPVYCDMISERQKKDSFTGSKSESQREFERLKDEELQKAEKTRADVYLNSFHLRNIEKQVTNFSKKTVWS